MLAEIIVPAIVGIWLGGIEWRMRSMDARLRDAPSRDEVNEAIEVRQEVVKAMQEEIKDDIKKMEHKLDELLRLLYSNQKNPK